MSSCNPALALITGAIRGSSTEELYNELRLETEDVTMLFYKVYKSHSPKYLLNIIPVTVYITYLWSWNGINWT